MYQRPTNQKTAAGAINDNFGLKPNPKAYGEDGEGKEMTSALVNWSVTQGRVFIVRVTLAFLYATGVMAFLGFLSTLGADSEANDSAADRKRRYLCALSVVVNMVAVAHYKIITKIRGYEFGVGATASTFEQNGVSAFTPHNKKIAIGVEMAVDGIRHSDWLVRIPESACLTMHAHGRTSCHPKKLLQHAPTCPPLRRSRSSSSSTRSTTLQALRPTASPPRLAPSSRPRAPPLAPLCSWSFSAQLSALAPTKCGILRRTCYSPLVPPPCGSSRSSS
tara:strand:+ start:1397 stop:2227 length:831 start_codon:yes stop_codon:yes gene_type:complete